MDAKGEIIYVGKAKNLLKRTTSYFTDSKGNSFKTVTMVKHAARLEYLVVETEHDALLLESTLIKKNQPRYNVNLKDGKSYTFICIRKERFPKVYFTRRIYRDGSEYFGPYTSKYKAEIILEFIKSIFPLRNCTINLSQENIEAKKFKVCLEYHIKNCLGPCEAFETEKEYNGRIKQINKPVGAILTALFPTSDVNPAISGGLLSGDTKIFFANLIGSMVVIAYTMVMTYIVFKIVGFFMKVRVSEEDEKTGLDATQHGEKAFMLR